MKTELKPVLNEPVLLINNKILVVTDLHIGIESELREQGINTASQTHMMKNHLISLCEKYKPKEIILLGDIKHNIPLSTKQERKDVVNFLETIQTYGIIHIITGNHDGNIRKLSVDEITIHPSDGFLIKNIGFIHGHRWPKEEILLCEQIIMGHTHPTIMFTDRLGFKTFESCWIKSSFIKDKLKEKCPNSTNPKILVMPAFNPLCGGIAVNQEGVTGPIGKLIDIHNSQIYLINGTYLGKIKDIR
jgi:putative SbcD/Mre11-related phosphoesterase